MTKSDAFVRVPVSLEIDGRTCVGVGFGKDRQSAEEAALADLQTVLPSGKRKKYIVCIRPANTDPARPWELWMSV